MYTGQGKYRLVFAKLQQFSGFCVTYSIQCIQDVSFSCQNIGQSVALAMRRQLRATRLKKTRPGHGDPAVVGLVFAFRLCRARRDLVLFARSRAAKARNSARAVSRASLEAPPARQPSRTQGIDPPWRAGRRHALRCCDFPASPESTSERTTCASLAQHRLRSMIRRGRFGSCAATT